MTAICPGGGPSQIIPGEQELQQMLAGAIADFLVAQEMDWAAPLASGLGYLAFDLLNLCATDPPALPAIDAARIAGYFNPVNSQGAVQLREDMTALVGHYLWFNYCECVTGPQPPAPAPTPQPPGYQTDNPQVGAPTGTPCGSENDLGTAGSFDASGTFVDDSPNIWAFPTSMKWIKYSTNLGAATPAGAYPVAWQFDWKASQAGPVLGSTFYTQQSHDAVFRATVNTATIPPGAVYPVIKAYSPAIANTSQQVAVAITPFCTEAPPQLVTPCCPPDPTLENLISQVLRLEYQILSMFSPGKLPFVDSTVHASLSGTGAVSISPAAAAVRVDIVSRPTPWPDNPGTPDFLFSIGFITPFAVGTPLRGSRLVYDHQTFQYPSYTDQIGYTLPGGVMINLVELVTAPPGA